MNTFVVRYIKIPGIPNITSNSITEILFIEESTLFRGNATFVTKADAHVIDLEHFLIPQPPTSCRTLKIGGVDGRV
jgi:hypothetical protein